MSVELGMPCAVVTDDQHAHGLILRQLTRHHTEEASVVDSPMRHSMPSNCGPSALVFPKSTLAPTRCLESMFVSSIADVVGEILIIEASS